ncbi:MAG TPA: helix-turn-helix domain-containing protein [Candidatus Didemnitutus sp.]|nr:helix-turn-helix domain-containing protein [Candidatus Didemnitutus sp.]
METPTLAPAEKSERQLVSCLQQSQVFRDYKSAFETTTGLPLTLRRAGAFQPPLAGSKQMNPFCALMAASNKSCAACLQMQQCAEAQAGNNNASVQCFAGLTESSIPVRDGERVIGFLQTGQVFLRRPTVAGFQRTINRLTALGATFDRAALRIAYFQTRVLAREQYESIVRLVTIFAQHLGAISNQLLTQQSCGVPPSIARACQFIAEHQSEGITIKDGARASNMSVYYFCKVFHHAMGLTFTKYLARRRIEHVRQMLLNPHTRVSEAAYAAGFQSLSQFNRVFQSVSGESPSAYRERVHGAKPVDSIGGRTLMRAA